MPDDDRDARRRAWLGRARALVDQLTPEERHSLRQSVGLMAKVIPEAHQERLIKLGLGEHRLGGFGLTELGKVAAKLP